MRHTRDPVSRADPSLALDVRTGLPDALQQLQAAFPREGWRLHPNFNEMVQFWMDRHIMFREVLSVLEADAQARLDDQIGADTYAQRLSRYGSFFVNQLHGHHQIEDTAYFPKLMGLEPALDHGFGLLDGDHAEIDPGLEDLVTHMNTVLGGQSAGPLSDALAGFAIKLNRHLTDEEELIVPIILKSGFRG